MMVAGSPGEFKVVVCDTLTGECWSKSTNERYQDNWHPMASPGLKFVVQPAKK